MIPLPGEDVERGFVVLQLEDETARARDGWVRRGGNGADGVEGRVRDSFEGEES